MPTPVLDVPSAVQLAALRVGLRQRLTEKYGPAPSALESIAQFIKMPIPGPQQEPFVVSLAKRKIIRAGRRGGKTVGMAILALLGFLVGHRVLYTAPTADQIEAFWWEVKAAMLPAVDAGRLVKNETERLIELPGTRTRIRAKTAWNADTLRGDYADLLLLDEWQLMNEDAWERVGAPMLLDNDGDAVFCYTPPSLHSRSLTKASDPRHAARLFKVAQADASGRWAAFHFGSRDNPFISVAALGEISRDMTALAYRQEILAEDAEDAPGALWTRALIEKCRVIGYPGLQRVIVGVDPPGGAVECGIVTAGLAMVNGEPHGYILEDSSLRASPDTWAGEVLTAYIRHKADRVVGEANYGGDMVESTIRQAAKSRGQEISYKSVQATRGKAVRAEPIVALFEQGRIHLVGAFPLLEEEMTGGVPGVGGPSPNRLDAAVWALTELMLRGGGIMAVTAERKASLWRDNDGNENES